MLFWKNVVRTTASFPGIFEMRYAVAVKNPFQRTGCSRYASGFLIAGVVAALLGGAPEAVAASEARQPGNFGIGLGVGYAAGLSGKYILDSSSAIQATLGTFGAFDGDVDGVALGTDYLFEMPAFVAEDAIELAWNVGVGGGVAFFDDDDVDNDANFALSVQGVLGFEVNFVPIPFDIVIEFRPELRVLEEPDFDIDLGAHLRYYF